MPSTLPEAQTQLEAYWLGKARHWAESVPGYKAFLKDKGIEPAGIREFATLPVMTKENYVQAYPLGDRCRDGELAGCDMVAVSSGSTGQPTFWLRTLQDEQSVAERFKQVFQVGFGADTIPTLAVVCFTLGTWVGGMYTANCCRLLAQSGFPVTVVTPGNNKAEIFRVVQLLGPEFAKRGGQVVLLGYPPFLKDVIDEGLALLEPIDWAALNIKLVTAGEVFSESWRSLVRERVGGKHPCFNSASLYGTADGGVLGNETPLSIAIRRFLADTPTAARALFGEERLPTLVQYDPYHRYFERLENGQLMFSGDSGVPLVRYNILDKGGVVSYPEMMDFLAQYGFDPHEAVLGEAPEHYKNRMANGWKPPEQPFVFVFGRSHFAVSYYGANVYPENVMVGLEQPEFQQYVTGKFVLSVETDEQLNPYLSIVTELAPGVSLSGDEEAALTRRLAESIRQHLLKLNSEFANYTPTQGQTPTIKFLPHGHPDYFPVGNKHRYTKN